VKICRPHDTARAAGAKIREVVGLCSGPNQNSLHVSSDLIRTRAVRVQALGALANLAYDAANRQPMWQDAVARAAFVKYKDVIRDRGGCGGCTGRGCVL
jgi:hypothetical protein